VRCSQQHQAYPLNTRLAAMADNGWTGQWVMGFASTASVKNI
jgi:hypothetical protein